MAYTVKAVADLAGITIRTLHHYDEIGLLKPATVTDSGYRHYTEADLERLQQVLFFRELGVALGDIKEIIDSPSFDRRDALRSHRKMLVERRERLERLIQSVDKTLDAVERGIQMNEKEMFDGFEPSKYEEEVKQRWGQTDAYKQSAQRTKKYTKADWDEIKAEGKAINEGLAALMDRRPDDPEVQEFVRRHHQQINDRFYTCSMAIYRGLAEMYVADERFKATYEKVKPGMAEFLRAAMLVYADKLDGAR